MKALPKKVFPLTLFAIAVTSLICVRPAEAYTITLHQAGSNVVATGSGAINLTGLTFSSTQSGAPFINPSFPGIRVGAGAPCDVWDGIAGPTSFGSGGVTPGSIGIGDLAGLSTNELNVPQGYVSGTTLTTGSATFNNATFASLGVTPGTYVWTWGTGLPNQNFTLIIGGAGVPDGGSTVSLLGFALLGLTALRRKLPLLRGGSHESLTQETPTADTFRNCRHVALLRSACPRFHHDAAASRVQRRGERKRSD